MSDITDDGFAKVREFFRTLATRPMADIPKRKRFAAAFVETATAIEKNSLIIVIKDPRGTAEAVTVSPCPARPAMRVTTVVTAESHSAEVQSTIMSVAALAALKPKLA